MAKKRDTSMDLDYILKSAAAQGLDPSKSMERISKASIAASVKPAMDPILKSVSKLEQVSSSSPAVDTASDELIKTTKDTNQKIQKTNELIEKQSSLLKQFVDFSKKSTEENRELLARLSRTTKPLGTSSVGATGVGAAGVGVEAPGAASGKPPGGGAPGDSGSFGMMGAAGAGLAGMIGGKALGAFKGAGKGLLKGGLATGVGMAAYGLAPQFVKDALGQYGVDETTIGIAGAAGTAGYAGYKAYQGMKGVSEAVKPPTPDVVPDSTPKVEPKQEPKPRHSARGPDGRYVKADAVDPTKNAAESAKNAIAKEAGGEAAEKAGKAAAKTAGKDAVKKAITKVASSKAVSAVAKKVPVLGALAGLGFAISRAMEGDYKGAAAEAASGVMGGSGVGVAGSLAIDAGLMARDIYKELYNKFPEDDETGLRQERVAEIQTEVARYIKDLVKSNSNEPVAAPTTDAMGNVIGPSETAPEPAKPNPEKIDAPTNFSGDAFNMDLDYTKHEGSGQPGVAASQPTRGSRKSDAVVREFAEKMGLDPNANYEAELRGGVPISINGKPVPKELYSKDQADTIEQVNKIRSQMEALGGGDAPTASAGRIEKPQRRSKESDAVVRELAAKMGMDPNQNYQAEMRGGVPVSINGKPVPKELYTPDQADTVEQVNKVRAQLQQLQGGDATSAARAAAISEPPKADGGGAPIVVKGGDTINNITNASGAGGSGGGGGSPSRIPNPWDNLVFGSPWAAYP